MGPWRETALLRPVQITSMLLEGCGGHRGTDYSFLGGNDLPSGVTGACLGRLAGRPKGGKGGAPCHVWVASATSCPCPLGRPCRLRPAGDGALQLGKALAFPSCSSPVQRGWLGLLPGASISSASAPHILTVTISLKHYHWRLCMARLTLLNPQELGILPSSQRKKARFGWLDSNPDPLASKL